MEDTGRVEEKGEQGEKNEWTCPRRPGINKSKEAGPKYSLAGTRQACRFHVRKETREEGREGGTRGR